MCVLEKCLDLIKDHIWEGWFIKPYILLINQFGTLQRHIQNPVNHLNGRVLREYSKAALQRTSFIAGISLQRKLFLWWLNFHNKTSMYWTIYSRHHFIGGIIFRSQLPLFPRTKSSIADTPNNRPHKAVRARNLYTFYFRQCFAVSVLHGQPPLFCSKN